MATSLYRNQETEKTMHAVQPDISHKKNSLKIFKLKHPCKVQVNCNCRTIIGCLQISIAKCSTVTVLTWHSRPALPVSAIAAATCEHRIIKVDNHFLPSISNRKLHSLAVAWPTNLSH